MRKREYLDEGLERRLVFFKDLFFFRDEVFEEFVGGRAWLAHQVKVTRVIFDGFYEVSPFNAMSQLSRLKFFF